MASKLDQYRSSVFGNDPNVLTNNHNRESQLQGYLRNQSIARASLSRRDLQEYTDVKFFVSPNFASLASFITVLAVTLFLGWLGWARDIKGNYRAISEKNETLFTPVLWVVPSTWLIVFTSEAIFILFSFFNGFSHISIIQQAVGFHFFYINCCQIGWIVSYTYGIIWLAFVWMVLTVLFLIWLNFNLYYQDHIDQMPTLNLDGQRSSLPQSRRPTSPDDENVSMMPVYEWLIFRLPFQLHLGWALFNALLNLNEMAVHYDWDPLPQIALVSLVTLWIIGLFVLFYPQYPVFVIPLMISWAAGGVWINLRDPSEAVKETYDNLTISRVYGGIIATCIEHILIAFIRFIYFFANSYSLMEKERQ